jgi:hypothetical protein
VAQASWSVLPPAFAVGQDSSPAADVHVGLFALGHGRFLCAKSVLEDPRRPGGLPHNEHV